MPYNVYSSSNTLLPVIIINDDTLDTSSTSLAFIGRKLRDYGNAQQQDMYWLLENFANSSPPSSPVVGQLWYDISQTELKVYQGSNAWRKVGAPQAIPTAPVVPFVGQLWYDISVNVLKVWSGSVWIVVGPTTTVPATAYQQLLSFNTTTDATTTELWINGTTGSRLSITNNSAYTFESVVSARRTDSGTEFAGWKITGTIINVAGTVSFGGTPSITTFGSTSGWTVACVADNVNDTLNILVTGQTSKVINWRAVTSIYII